MVRFKVDPDDDRLAGDKVAMATVEVGEAPQAADALVAVDGEAELLVVGLNGEWRRRRSVFLVTQYSVEF